jgi:hypothetical protein
LVALRTANNLTPGQYYRITDYVTTTAKSDTLSVGHAFDIIVRADTSNKLNEEAYASLHGGTTYFANCKLEAWKLKYCLDNDTDRFDWADSTNGKGVIYRMIDEYGNDCPYDFKNIQFKRYKITACTNSPSLVGSYSTSGITGITVNTSTTYWCYTFSMIDNIDNSGAHDVSVEQNKYPSDDDIYYHIHDNIIKSMCSDAGQLKLPNNVFVTDTDLCSIGDNYNYGDFFGYYNNTFGNYCRDNTFGHSCKNNTFGYCCYSNTFGNNYSDNILGDYCYCDVFGDSCYSNTFGNYFYSNTFGNECVRNTFGDYCSSNTFGNYFYSNTFGNNCNNNTFGYNCSSNTFGNNCDHINFQKNYTRHVIVEDGNSYINLTSTATTSNSALLYNIKISQGCNAVISAKTISHNTVNDTAPTTYKPTDSVEKLI